MKHNLTVGQELWFVPSRGFGKPSVIKITKLGRRWAETNQRYKIDINTLSADGGRYNSPGKAYLSKAEWSATQRRDILWTAIRNGIQSRWWIPEHLSTDDLMTVLRILEIPEGTIKKARSPINDLFG